MCANSGYQALFSDFSNGSGYEATLSPAEVIGQCIYVCGIIIKCGDNLYGMQASQLLMLPSDEGLAQFF